MAAPDFVSPSFTHLRLNGRPQMVSGQAEALGLWRRNIASSQLRYWSPKPITKPRFARIGRVGPEAHFLDRDFVERFVELDAAVASDAPNQLTRHSRQGSEIEDDAIPAFELSALDLDHAPVA